MSILHDLATTIASRKGAESCAVPFLGRFYEWAENLCHGWTSVGVPELLPGPL